MLCAIGILRIRRARYGLQLQRTCWPLVTNYQVITPARLMSEVSVITPQQGTVFLLKRQRYKIYLIHVHVKIWFCNLFFFRTNYFKKYFVACCIQHLGVGPSSYGVHRLFFTRGCNCKPHWTDVPIECFLLQHTWAILPSWNQTQNLSLSPP